MVQVKEDVMRFFAILSLSFMGLIFVGCGNDNPATPVTTGSITGVVTDSISGVGVSGASIITVPATSSVTASTAGQYTITGVNPGTYMVSASKTSYNSKNINISVTAGNVATANISLSPGVAGNNAPTVPCNPNPASGSTGLSTSLVRTWECSDPDIGDTLRFDICSDTVNPPISVVAHNIIGALLGSWGLPYSTTYYWKIVAKDNHGAITEGPVWSFTTKASGLISGSGQLAVSSSDNRDTYSFVDDTINYGKITLVWFSPSVISFEANGIIVGVGDTAPDSGYAITATVSVAQGYFVKTDNAVHYAKVTVVSLSENVSTGYTTVDFNWILQTEANNRNLY